MNEITLSRNGEFPMASMKLPNGNELTVAFQPDATAVDVVKTMEKEYRNETHAKRDA